MRGLRPRVARRRPGPTTAPPSPPAARGRARPDDGRAADPLVVVPSGADVDPRYFNNGRYPPPGRANGVCLDRDADGWCDDPRFGAPVCRDLDGDGRCDDYPASPPRRSVVAFPRCAPAATCGAARARPPRSAGWARARYRARRRVGPRRRAVARRAGSTRTPAPSSRCGPTATPTASPTGSRLPQRRRVKLIGPLRPPRARAAAPRGARRARAPQTPPARAVAPPARPPRTASRERRGAAPPCRRAAAVRRARTPAPAPARTSRGPRRARTRRTPAGCATAT
jgi:hypothetical protein